VTQSDRNKLFLTLIGLAAALYTLWPTFQFYALPPAKRQEVLQARPATATNDADRDRLTKMATLRDKAIKLGLDLQGGLYLLLEVDRSKLGPAEARGAVDQAMQIIRNRIDQFGVAEPSIQKQGENRILVQLPGLLDQERAKELIGQTALLDFKIVKTDEEARALFDRIDQYFERKVAEATGGRPDSTAHPWSSRFLSVAQSGESFVLP
jgi:preprotein translocase subunit SecD